MVSDALTSYMCAYMRESYYMDFIDLLVMLFAGHKMYTYST